MTYPPTATWPQSPLLLHLQLLSVKLFLHDDRNQPHQDRVEDPRYCATMCQCVNMFHESWIMNQNEAQRTVWEAQQKNSLLQMKSDNSVWQPLPYPVMPLPVASPTSVWPPIPGLCRGDLRAGWVRPVLVRLFHSTKFCLVQWHYTQNFDIDHLIHTTSYIP